MVIGVECKCDKVLEILKETKKSVKEEYSKHEIVNADFVRAKKAMFYERIANLFNGMKEEKGVD